MNQWILQLIGLIIGVASPELRAMLSQWLEQLAAQAKKTANPWDDMLVGMLTTILLGQGTPKK